MKNHLLILFIFLVPSLWSQEPEDCMHNVSTDYNNPTNTSLPVNPLNPTGQINYLNEFNWNEKNVLGSWSPYASTGLSFNGFTYPSMANINSGSLLPYYQYLTQDPLNPEDGWELMLVNLGFYPDNTAHSATLLNSFPYIVLYNRYQEIIRVYMAYGNNTLPNDAIDVIKMRLRFQPVKTNGLLRQYSGVDVALDQLTEVTEAVAVAQNPGEANRWWSADFNIAYDPCVCFHESMMQLQFELISNSSIKLYGRGITIDEALVNGASGIVPETFLSGFDYSDSQAEGGMIIYKAMQNLIDDYLAQLEDYKSKMEQTAAYNKRIDRNIAILRAFKFITSTGSSAVSAVTGQAWFPLLVNNAADMVGPDSLNVTRINAAVQKILPEGFKLLETKGEMFQKKTAPAKPAMPTASFTEMYFDGTIDDIDPVAGPDFYTPGTYGSPGTGTPVMDDEPYNYPVYNEKLGLFALLESPSVTISKTAKDSSLSTFSSDWYVSELGPPNPSYQSYQTWTKLYQIKLKDPLVYTFNDIPDISNYNIKAGFKIEAVPKYIGGDSTNIEQGLLSICDIKVMNAYTDPNYMTNVETYDFSMDTATSILTFTKDYPAMRKFPQLSTYQNYISQNGYTLIGFNIEDSIKDVTMQTPIVPIDAFQAGVSQFGILNETYRSDCSAITPYSTISSGYEWELKVQLQLIVDIEFETLNSDGEHNRTTQMLTYNVSDIDWATSDIVSNLAGSSLDITQYPENLSLININFDGSPVEDCKINGSTYTCRAWNNITIEGNLTTSNGYDVLIIAGNQIEEINNSSVSPEIDRYILPVLNYSSPMPEADPTAVYTFCNTTTGNDPHYKANSASKILVSDNQFIDENQAESANIDFVLFPNPSSGKTFLSIKADHAVNGRITVQNITGQVIEAPVSTFETNKFEIDMTGFTKGVYFITLTSPEGFHTKQFILQ